MYIKQNYKMPILALTLSSLILTGCGGSSSSEQGKLSTPAEEVDQVSPAPEPASESAPTPEATPEPAPEPLTLTVDGPSEVLEKTDFILALAVEGEGTVESVNWTHDSSLNLVMSKESDHSVKLSVPDINQDHTVSFTVSAVSDSEQKIEHVHSVTLKRITNSLVVEGVVTDSPIQHAQVKLLVGGSSVEVEANELGEYTAALEVDESEIGEMLKLVAVGSSSQPEVEFVSQLGTFASLQEQAGDDAILSKNENFSVNVTNVTTAEYALLQRADVEIVDDESLNEALLSIDGDTLLDLATVIKVIVDSEEYSLPEGVSSTLELVNNEQQTEMFKAALKANNPSYFEQVKEQILDDDNLTSKDLTALQGDFLLYHPKYHNHYAYHLSLDESGQGQFVAQNSVEVTNVSYVDEKYVVELAEPAIFYRSERYKRGDNNEIIIGDDNNPVNVQISWKSSKLSLKVLHVNQGVNTVELNTYAEEYVDDVLNSAADLNTKNTFRLLDKKFAQSLTREEFVGKTWLIDADRKNFSVPDQVVNRYVFNEDGTATIEGQGGNVVWELDGNSLVIDHKNEETEFSTQYWLTKSIASGFYIVAKERQLEEGVVTNSVSLLGTMFPKKPDLNVTEDQLVGKWTGFIGRTQRLHDLRVFPDLNVKVGVAELTPYAHGKLENNRFYRKWYRNTTDYGTCYELNPNCQLSALMEYEFLSLEDNNYVVYRKVVESPGTEYQNVSYAGLFHYHYTPENEYSAFNSIMLGGNTTFFVESEIGGIPKIDIRTDDNDDYIIALNGVDYPMSIVDGYLQYTVEGIVNRISLLNESDDHIEVCVFEAAQGCQDHNKQVWFYKPEALPRKISYFFDKRDVDSAHYTVEQRWDGTVEFKESSAFGLNMNAEVVGSKIILTVGQDAYTPEHAFERIDRVEIEDAGEKFKLTITRNSYDFGQIQSAWTTDELKDKVDARNGIQILPENMIGQWSVPDYVLHTYHFEDGTGYKVNNVDYQRKDFTWSIDGGNVLNLVYNYDLVERITVVDDIDVGYQFIMESGNTHPYSSFSYGISDWMIKHQPIQFSQDDYVGRWLRLRLAPEGPQLTAAMEVYDDMTVHHGTETAALQGYYDNGQLILGHYYDHQLGRYVRQCEDRSQCTIYDEYVYTPIAQSGSLIYFTGANRVESGAHEFFIMRKQERPFEDGFTHIHTSFNLIDENNNSWVGHGDGFKGFLTIPLRGEFEFEIYNGKIYLTLDDGHDYVIEIVPQSNTVEGISFCMYQTEFACTPENVIRLRYQSSYLN
ncbi:procyclic acidic repetitive family protein [Pseudoalteromonas umbrosa]|uniref:procyclic acidic repetitive family protein n=1 Tax=Pseudoalteromonas umbrosa TaxID=3048489 RepID=UPI0024C31C8A|nr:procyclic acidic repetitive family protein [Pseudoalteromonas sp. B95]MDK1285984.1 procyclic acidic repetitive family protein [Pseudoalteromonas sp. B95]